MIHLWLSRNALPLVILVILVLLFAQRCSDPTFIPQPTTVTVRDTQWIPLTDTIYAKPLIFKSGRDTILERTIEYIPSEDYGELVAQFEKLKQDLFTKNEYVDSFKVDSFGTVKVIDTIQRNKVLGRSYVSNLKLPVITNTITHYPKPKKQVYVGGGVMGNPTTLVNGAELGVLYKDKKDRMFGAGVQKQFDNSPISYQLSTYFKIKF